MAGEESKDGVAAGAVDRVPGDGRAAREVRLRRPDDDAARWRPTRSRRGRTSRRLRELAERLSATGRPGTTSRVLSMGTSQDFEVAVEEGATVLRLGSVLYA